MLTAKFKFKTRSIKRSLSQAIRAAWYQTVRAPLGNLSWWAWTRFPFLSHRIISRRNGIRTFQTLTLVEVNPERVSHFVLDADVQRKIMLWPGDWDCRSRPLSEHYRYRLMADLWQHQDDLTASLEYHNLINKLNHGEAITRINKGQLVDTPEKALLFLESQLDIFFSLEKHGFKPELAQDELNIAIARDGRFIKANAGRKRLIAAKILKLPTVPVRIAYVHQQWLEKHHSPGDSRGQSLKMAITAAVKMNEV